MLTIKHITDTGEEFVYSTSHINFVPAEVKCATGQPNSLWRYDDTGRAFEITEGMVYVMNGSGATVARYDMTAKNNPAIGTVTGLTAGPIGTGGIA